MTSTETSAPTHLPAFRLVAGDTVHVDGIKATVTRVDPVASFLTRSQEAAGMARPQRLRLTLRPANRNRSIRTVTVDQYASVRCYRFA